MSNGAPEPFVRVDRKHAKATRLGDVCNNRSDAPHPILFNSDDEDLVISLLCVCPPGSSTIQSLKSKRSLTQR